MKRVVFGEFLKDVDLSFLKSLFGIEENEDDISDGPEEKAGFQRLGSTDPSENYGESFILITLLFVCIILSSLLFYALCWRISPKCKKYTKALKDKIFFSPIIRYAFLNSLKLNFIAMAAFKGFYTEEEPVKIMPFIICICINSVPILLAYVMCRKSKTLENEETVKMYGTVYQGRKVEKERNHCVWAYPITFFYRRTAFMAATVFLFD